MLNLCLAPQQILLEVGKQRFNTSCMARCHFLFLTTMDAFMRPMLLLSSTFLCALLFLCSPSVLSQEAAVPKHEAIMDSMVGKWLMTGTIAGEQVTHDLTAEWILGRRYVRIHEVSRERDEDGQLAYEAWIHIAWDADNAEYVVMWLDNTDTTNFDDEGVGHGKPDGDSIPFVWHFSDGGGLRNTFEYDRGDDTWSWTIENVSDSGRADTFAKLFLKRE